MPGSSCRQAARAVGTWTTAPGTVHMSPTQATWAGGAGEGAPGAPCGVSWKMAGIGVLDCRSCIAMGEGRATQLFLAGESCTVHRLPLCCTVMLRCLAVCITVLTLGTRESCRNSPSDRWLPWLGHYIARRYIILAGSVLW